MDRMILAACILIILSVAFIYIKLDKLEEVTVLIAENVTSDFKYLESINEYNLKVLEYNKETESKQLLKRP